MSTTPPDSDATRPAAIADAKRLLRIARTATLATLDPESGAPLATLVGAASDLDGAPLFLMSTLARHTRHLASDPRASILLTEAPERGDPLNGPRITLNGVIEATSEPRARQRYLQRNPTAKLYADFGDFAFFRLRAESIHFNGGFGRADALTPADILTPRDADNALSEAEPRILADLNALGDEALARLAGRDSGRRLWTAIGLDAEGLDLASGTAAARVSFTRPAGDEASWRRLLAQARDSARA